MSKLKQISWHSPYNTRVTNRKFSGYQKVGSVLWGVHAWQAGVWTREYPSRVQVHDPVARPSHSSQVRIQEHDQQKNVVPKTLNLETISTFTYTGCQQWWEMVYLTFFSVPSRYQRLSNKVYLGHGRKGDKNAAEEKRRISSKYYFSNMFTP